MPYFDKMITALIVSLAIMGGYASIQNVVALNATVLSQAQ